jgi:hypothetical protein
MFMPRFNEEKKRLLLELKVETLNQLSAVQAEDPERFLISTESCSSIMEALDEFNLKENPITDDSNPEWRGIFQEILAIREQISILIPPLFVKIKQKADSEKQLNFVKRRYNQDDQPLPSIFLDKKI